MTLTSGFFNSSNDDRLYDAIEMSRIFDGVILDGVFASIGDHLRVFAGTGMVLNVGTGRAWFNHTWTYNDALEPVTIPNAHPTLPRIDIVYLEINSEIATRRNSVGVLQGTAASSPVAPTITNTTNVHRYPLGHIYVAPAVTSLSQATITNKVGSAECPFVTGPLAFITTDEIIEQWQVQWEEWFAAIQDQLSEDAATNLQDQIWAIVGNIQPPLITLWALKAHNHAENGPVPQIPTSGVQDDAIDFTKVGHGVPQQTRRQGGSSSNWNVGGNINYLVEHVKIQHGVARWTGGPAYFGYVIVTYPEAFSANPNIIPGIQGQSTEYQDISCTVDAVTPTAFRIYWRSTGQPTQVDLSWIAIGKE